MPSIFISYKRDHAPSAQLVRALEEALIPDFEILRDVSIEPGQSWSKQLSSWLLGCDIAIAIVSDAAERSQWCRREWGVLAARQQHTGLLVIPVYLDDATLKNGYWDATQGLKWSGDALLKIREQLELCQVRVSSPRDFLAAHQAWLRWQFEREPVLGQEPYALADVYIESECGDLAWGAMNGGAGRARLDPFVEANGGRRRLLDCVIDRMADRTFRDLVVVQAGPGSGKSAFTLRLANHLIDRGFTPIVVRFRDLRLATLSEVDELIDDAIRIGHTDEESPPPKGAIVSELFEECHELNGSPICRAVIILDGWDEVSLSGNVSYRTQLRGWLPRLREYFIKRRTPFPIRVILTGRPSAEVGESGALQQTTPVLTIRPTHPDQLRAYASLVQKRLAAAPEAAWSIQLDTLAPLFENYERWFQRYTEGSEPNLASSGDVLGSPLLAYLSLRVIAESGGDPKVFVSEPTALYKTLIDTTVSHAGKSHDAQLESAAHRGGEGLRHLLREVASTITILGSETVSADELQARFDDPELPIARALLVNWSSAADSKNALRELVINFYFKGGLSALGCEFLHKSFREYLFAEAVVAALQDHAITETPERYAGLEHWQDFPEGSAAFRLSRRLSYLLSSQWLTYEVEQHLSWLLRDAARREPKLWLCVRDLVTEVYAWWAEAVHLRHQPGRSRSSGPRWIPPFVDTVFNWTTPLEPGAVTRPDRTNRLDAQLGRPLLRIACALHEELPSDPVVGTGRRNGYQSVSVDKVRFKPGGPTVMRAFVARIDGGGWRYKQPFHRLVSGPVDLSNERLAQVYAQGSSLRGADLTGTDLTMATLADADLSSASLSDVTLTRAYLPNANLSGADLSRARLDWAQLARAVMTGATLVEVFASNARLRGVELAGANLSRANLSGADLARANLKNADLTAADLGGANLSRVNLRGAKLSNANLSATNLSRATLQRADLSAANLRNAKLARAILRKANLSGANLSHCNLVGADLSFADLSNADLTGADLRGADLSFAILDSACLSDADLTGSRTAPASQSESDFPSSPGPSPANEVDERTSEP